MKYAHHLARMIEYATENEEKLMKIIGQLFTPIKKDGEDTRFIVNPKLNQSLLDKITKDTRAAIVKLYIKCEEDFRKGLELFDDIIKEKELDRLNRQGNELSNQLDEELR